MKLSLEKIKELLPDATPDRRGKYVRATCPACSHPSFTLSLDDGHKCGCNRKNHCGVVFNIFTLAKKLGKLSILNIEGEVGAIEKLENKIKKSDTSYDIELPTIKMPVGWVRSYKDEYMDSRGFTEYERYQIGRTQVHPKLKKNYVIAAITDGGIIKGYIARHVWSKGRIEAENKIRKQQGLPEILRYRNSDNDFSKMAFGFDEIVEGETHTIICVEGIFDKWNIDKLMKLHDQNEVKCNATFKCAISIEQMYKWAMKGVKTFILFYDPDVIQQIKRVAGELQLYFNVLIAFNSDITVDAGDIDAEGLSSVFSELRTVNDFTTGKVTNKLK